MRCCYMIDYALQGLKDQAEERLAVASCPCNFFRWQPPRVIFFFPEVSGSSAPGNRKHVLYSRP